MVATRMQARKKQDDQDPEEHISNFRQRLERSFAVFDGDSDDPMSAFIRQESALEEDRSVTQALDHLFQLDTIAETLAEEHCEGENCDLDIYGECAIPESFKIVAGEDSVDVMAFLGIRRAEPLKAKKGNGDHQ